MHRHGADRYGYGADFHDTKVDRQELRAIREADHNPVFQLQAQIEQDIANTVSGLGQLGIGNSFVLVVNGDFTRAAFD